MSDTHAGHEAKHPYHLVDPSPWPIVGAIAALLLTGGLVLFMHGIWGFGGKIVLALGVVGVLGTMFFWWRDVVKEATFQGFHTPVVQIGMRYGMALFIASEVMFFAAWFWAYFNAFLFPTEQIGHTWPPPGVQTFDPFELPLLNTLILLLSGVTVTWAHHALREGDRKGMLQGLALTILLGATFTCVQAYEYSHAAFTLPRQHLRLDLLHGDRLPRLPRHHRHHLPDRLLVPRPGRPLQARPPFRLRGRGLVLALRRRGLAVPVHLHLRRRRRRGGALTAIAYHPPQSAFSTGLACRCPRCGRGKLFAGYLTLAAQCEVCQLDFGKADSGDGPAVFLILILGALAVLLAYSAAVRAGAAGMDQLADPGRRRDRRRAPAAAPGQGDHGRAAIQEPLRRVRGWHSLQLAAESWQRSTSCASVPRSGPPSSRSRR